jgi:hypothetical protein
MGTPTQVARDGPAYVGDPFARRLARVVACAAVLTGIAFPAITTFIGDDHLFLAFARYAPNPLVGFVRDLHGGEFYRPVPMLLWWVLGRAAGGSKMPFAILSFALHAVAAWEVGVLVLEIRRDRRGSADVRAGAIAAALFFVAPVTQEAAFWYAASTDLLATVFALAAVIASLRERLWQAALFFAAACWSKESALVVPALAAIALRAQKPGRGWHAIAARAGCLLPVACVYAVARFAVLGGIGRSGDTQTSTVGKLVQILSGLAHAPTGSVITHEAIAWSIGLATWGLLAITVARARWGARGPEPEPTSSTPLPALGWVLVAVAPLLAAPWIVGARYFYLPAVGIAWLAAEVLARARTVIVVGVLAALAGLDAAQFAGRSADIRSYDSRLAAARRAVADGLDHGFNTFHVAAGIKDLDLAVKEDPRFAPHESDLVVIGDVPASFVALPRERMSELDFLVARPPLPPAGAYAFGDRRVVGLARRGDDPTLDEVLGRLPDMRFIRLRLGPGGRIITRDVTDTLRGSDPDPAPVPDTSKQIGR